MYKIHNTILLIRSGLTTNYAFWFDYKLCIQGESRKNLHTPCTSKDPIKSEEIRTYHRRAGPATKKKQKISQQKAYGNTIEQPCSRIPRGKTKTKLYSMKCSSEETLLIMNMLAFCSNQLYQRVANKCLHGKGFLYSELGSKVSKCALFHPLLIKCNTILIH